MYLLLHKTIYLNIAITMRWISQYNKKKKLHHMDMTLPFQIPQLSKNKRETSQKV